MDASFITDSMDKLMKKSLFYILIILLSSFVILDVYAEEKTEYTIGVVPQFEIRHIRKIWNPIIKEVERKTGYRLRLVGSPTIPDFEREFNAGNFDFAYMNPYHMLLANESQGYTPLVRDTGRKLQGILVVNKSSNIKTIQDLEGGKIGFPAPNALGASLLMRSNLTNEHRINFTPVYVKTHSSVYLNVVVRQIDAGGGVQKTLNQQKTNIKGALRVLHRTPKVSPHPLAAHPRIPKKVRDELTNTLLKIGESEIGKSLLSKIPIKKIGPANISDYLELKQYHLDQFLVR